MKDYNVLSESDISDVVSDIYGEFLNRNLYKPTNYISCSDKAERGFYSYIVNTVIIGKYAQIDFFCESTQKNFHSKICDAIESVLSINGYNYNVTVSDGGRWLTYKISYRSSYDN